MEYNVLSRIEQRNAVVQYLFNIIFIYFLI